MSMLPQFAAYQLAVRHYRLCRELRLPAHLRDQMLRASSSVVLDLAEGSAKPTVKDRTLCGRPGRAVAAH
jgi:four helix bundle protein